MANKYSVVGFFARSHGLSGLNAVLNSKDYFLSGLLTHRLKPSSEYPARGEREDFSEYQSLAEKRSIPLYTVDSRADLEGVLEFLKTLGETDFIASISWRRLICPEILETAKIGAVNLHRGKLPDYCGAEPIKQALLKKDRYVHITAHKMTDQIDVGEIIDVYRHLTNYDNSKSLEENVERIKKELTPHFGRLLINSLNSLLENGKR